MTKLASEMGLCDMRVECIAGGEQVGVVCLEMPIDL